MNRMVLITIGCLLFSFSEANTIQPSDTTYPSVYDHAEWQNPLVFGVNKLPPRNPAWPNPDARSGWNSDYEHSAPGHIRNRTWKQQRTMSNCQPGTLLR